MSQDLARYLQELAEEGDKDSSGSFSIDYSKARSKISERLFADPSNYLLKFVQCGIASGAAPIRVQTRKSDLQVSFRSSLLHPDQLESLKEQLYSPELSSENKAMHHLALALHAARALQPDQLVFACRTALSGQALILHKESIRQLEIPGGQAGGECECLLLIRRTPKDHWVRRLLYQPRDLANDSAALVGRCGYSWSPIQLDNRTVTPRPLQCKGGGKFPQLVDRFYLSRSPVNQLLTLPAFIDRPAWVYDLRGQGQNLDSHGSTLLQQWRSYSLPRYSGQEPLFEPTASPSISASRHEISGPLSFALPTGIALYRGGYRNFSVNRDSRVQQYLYVPHGDQFTTSLYSRPGGLLGSPTPYPAGQAHFVVPTLPEQKTSALFFCHHGVLLDPIPVELPLYGMRVVLSDPKISTDLSGLQAIQNERFQQVLQWVQEESEKLKGELRRLLRMLEPVNLSLKQVRQLAERHDIQLDL